MEINKLIFDAHKNAVDHGFWEEWENLKDNRSVHIAFTSQNLMLIVSEIAEAQEGLRKGNVDNFREELADVAIRLFDLCGGLEIDLETEISRKMKINADRPYKHGKEF